MFRNGFAKTAGIFFVLMMLFGSIFQANAVESGNGGAPVSKISSLLPCALKLRTITWQKAGRCLRVRFLYPEVISVHQWI